MNTNLLPPAPQPEGFQQWEYPIAVQQLTLYSDAIDKEFTLVSDRMTWLVISESFICGAFATSAAYYEQSGSMKTLVASLLLLMPILGILLAAFVIPAIHAAHSAAVRLLTSRCEYEDRLPERLRVPLISLNNWEHHWGNIPSRTVPWLILIIWTMLLIPTLRCLSLV